MPNRNPYLALKLFCHFAALGHYQAPVSRQQDNIRGTCCVGSSCADQKDLDCLCTLPPFPVCGCWLSAPHSLDQHGSSPGVNSSESALQLFHEELLPVNTTCMPPNQRSLFLIILNSVPWPFKHEVHWADVAFICFVLSYYFWLKYSISLSFRDMFFLGPKPGQVWFGLNS